MAVRSFILGSLVKWRITLVEDFDRAPYIIWIHVFWVFSSLVVLILLSFIIASPYSILGLMNCAYIRVDKSLDKPVVLMTIVLRAFIADNAELLFFQ